MSHTEHRPAYRRSEDLRQGMVGCALAIALAAPVANAAAQRSVFAGQVVADSTFEPVAGAQVTLVELARRLDVAADGAFRFAGLPAGTYTVQVRALGFAPQSVRIKLTDGDSLVRDVLLVRGASVTSLAEVAVTAKGEPRVAPNLAEFERRRARGEGHYITPEQMDKQRARKVSDVLRSIPGMLLIRLPSGGVNVSTSRGLSSINRGRTARCYATLVLDGVVIYQDIPGTTPMNIDELSATDIAAVEYYPGAARMPPELGGVSSACGVLVFWTRSR